MQYLYPFIISFIFILLSELGDKTQILVLSFSAKKKISNILLGVALGTLFSHGLAIIFGSRLVIIENDSFIYYLKLLTYCTFFIFGITGFLKQKKSASIDNSTETNPKSNIIKFLESLTQNCVFLVAFTITIGELGDKTFLASLGLGLQYPQFKLPLILGCVCGMVTSNAFAVFLGKWLGSKISTSTIETLSNFIFILFGILGLLGLFF